MNSSKPYLLRALYEWIEDNGCTPHLLVDATTPGVEVPSAYVKDGQIVLNISSTAVRQLMIDNHSVRFDGRFGGVPTAVAAPIASVLGIYARENGKGMLFERDESGPPEPPEGDDAPPRRPSLKVVK